MTPTDRYLVLRQGQPVWSTSMKEDLAPYFWGAHIRDPLGDPDAPYQYMVLDYETPYVLDTANLNAFLARFPEDAL